FIISSFKNKERRNNPSSIPRPLLPPDKKKQEVEVEPEETPKNEVSEEKQEVQVSVQPRESTRKRKGQVNYKETFTRRNEIKTRECVYISREIHTKIVKLVRALEDTSITIGGYIDVVLSEHLEQHKDEINEIFRQSRRDLL
ncbi:DUF3408 domain-containing protein, partial [Bacteroidales bacterium OttesenSCG-928-J19]|nr:DUF3408 domain-containing protein [Bacteroidales bacterium OttesenSCG-928-J19]